MKKKTVYTIEFRISGYGVKTHKLYPMQIAAMWFVGKKVYSNHADAFLRAKALNNKLKN